MVVEHLTMLGHHQIGFLALPDQQRMAGYTRALNEKKLPLDANLIRQLDAERLFASAYELTIELIKTRPSITAIFTANDDAAIAAMAALYDLGLKVPDDISIASIDNTDVSNMVRPALTTAKIPIHAMGENALKLLLSLHHQPAIPPDSLIFPTELVVRESTAAPRA
jgi:LacI family transcriptional regulator